MLVSVVRRAVSSIRCHIPSFIISLICLSGCVCVCLCEPRLVFTARHKRFDACIKISNLFHRFLMLEIVSFVSCLLFYDVSQNHVEEKQPKMNQRTNAKQTATATTTTKTEYDLWRLFGVWASNTEFVIFFDFDFESHFLVYIFHSFTFSCVVVDTGYV